jgi:hypothetical protein
MGRRWSSTVQREILKALDDDEGPHACRWIRRRLCTPTEQHIGQSRHYPCRLQRQARDLLNLTQQPSPLPLLHTSWGSSSSSSSSGVFRLSSMHPANEPFFHLDALIFCRESQDCSGPRTTLFSVVIESPSSNQLLVPHRTPDLPCHPIIQIRPTKSPQFTNTRRMRRHSST